MSPQNTTVRFLFVVLLAVVTALFAFPSSLYGEKTQTWFNRFPVLLGLDLAGGTELDYEVILDDAIAQNNDDDPLNDVNIDQIVESVRDALEARVNPAGVGEVLVKRSQVDDQEHILVQLPPTSNVAAAKASAERDNRLAFFEENPGQQAELEEELEELLLSAQTLEAWNNLVESQADGDQITHSTREELWLSNIQPPALQEDIAALTQPGVVSQIVEGRAQVQYEVGEDGTIQVGGNNPFGPPPRILSLSYVTAIGDPEPRPTARHILLAYPGAERAPDNVPYESKEAAQAQAETLLAQLQSDTEADFAALAQEFSTGPSASQGGDLGIVAPGQMVDAFDQALFGELNEAGERVGPPAEKGLYPEIVETDFGFHIIELTDSADDQKITYEQLSWNVEDINWIETELGGKQLDNAVVGYDEIGQPIVNLVFDNEGAELFGALSERVAARSQRNECPDIGACRLGVKVGGQWVTQPTIRQKIFGRQAQISGSFTFEVAQALAEGLNLGAIDAPVRLSGELTIQPELGADQLSKSLTAGAIGLLATILFMVFIYRWAGVVAGVALSLYAGMFMTLLKIWGPLSGSPIVLSLAGIAGIALSIGLAVDGNVLIFERLREELKKGKNIYEAVELGFNRAWSAIRDSNITTLITCVILYNMGSSIVKGFAVTLILGTLLSLFTAVTISRTLLRFGLRFKALRAPKMYGRTERR